jgi:transmembrane sensor
MTNTSAQQINQEACAWIAKLHGGEPSQHEKEELRVWMAQSPAHKAEIRHLAKLWGELNVLTELAVVAELPVTESWWNSLSLSFLFRRRVLMGAMGCAVLVLMAVLVPPYYSDTTPHKLSPVLHTTVLHTTVVGEQQLITLDDGSTILLNTDSQVKVDYTTSARNIYLSRGQAHFDVVSNPVRPFRVFAGQGMVRAVGTAFSVYLKDRFLEVTVTEGSIELHAIHQPENDNELVFGEAALDEMERLVVVKAGQNVTFDPAVKTIKSIETVNALAISRKLAWREGLLKFSGDPLQEVVEEVSRYTDISIVILDPEIRELRIGGFFQVGEVEKMFEALETSFGVRVVRVDENLVHLAAAAPDDVSQ